VSYDSLMATFTAIDFETANRFPDSACAIAAVRVEHGKIVERYHRFVRPWSPRFEYTALHGIAWSHVREAPSFDRVWPELRSLLRGVDFVVAHDASFGLGVLAACCERAGVRPPTAIRAECTLQMARARGVRPATLPAVARHLGVRERRHHDALAALDDAETCAEIALAAGLAA
jgi:DNA polymerase III subunit epsilon